MSGCLHPSVRSRCGLRITVQCPPPSYLTNFLFYFESTWIGMGLELEDYAEILPFLIRCGMCWIATRSQECSTRTTNAMEAFLHSFNTLISSQHPSIWTLLDSLKIKEAAGTNAQHSNMIGEIERNDRILRLVSEYTPATSDRTLRDIAYN